MSSSLFKYYIFDAVYRWATDVGYTPYILVDTKVPGVRLPTQFHGQDSITLNISATAASNFSVKENNWLFFSARFSGQPHHIEIPLQAVQAIYANETGAGISFTGSQWDDPDGSPTSKLKTGKGLEETKTPALKIVK